MTLGLLLLISAFLCFVLATFGVSLGSINLTALGLAFWALSILIGSLEGLGSTLLIVLVVVVVLVLVIVLVQRGTFTRTAPPK